MRTSPHPIDTARMLRLAAPDPAGLLAALDAVDPQAPPAEIGWDGPGPRLALLDPTAERLTTARKLVAMGRPIRKRADLWFSPTPLLGAGGGGIAFVFPGLEGEFNPKIADVADRLNLAVPEISTATLGRHGTSVLAVGRLLDAALRRLAIRPSAVAGHSVGEWAAMIAGGIVSGPEFDAMIDRVDLDGLRVPGVEFAVIGCAAGTVRDELDTRPDLVISHENSANQTVVCGPEQAIAEVVALFRSRAVICQALPFRSGFHTPMLAPYLDYFRAGVPDLAMRPAAVPVWSATTATPFPDDPVGARELCVRHLVEPVRFRDLATALHESGVRAFVQVGPGQLGSLIEDTLRADRPGADFLVVAANSPHRAGLDQLRRCALALWTDGADPDFTVLDPIPVALPAATTIPEPTLTVEPAPPVAPDADPAAASGAAPWPGFAQLAALSATMPLAAEVAAFLDDTAQAMAAVLRAADGPARREVLEVSLRTMPYLRDHSLMRQRADWPDEQDLRAIMPATTMVTHMIAAAERACPGLVAAAVEDIGLHRWLPAVPARQVIVDVTPQSAGRVRVRLGEHAEGTVVLSPRRAPAPEGVWPAVADERAPEFTSEQIYRQRWMFHGPAFQGMTRAIGVSGRTIRGEITVPPAPGALLDNLGQLLGQWLVEQAPARWIALPARIDRIDRHAAEPEPGAVLDCRLRVTELTEDVIVADGQLSWRGRPVITVTGWAARRFDSDERASSAYRMASTATMSERHAHGWWWVAERWRTLSSREFYLHRYAGSAEAAEYAALGPAQRRAWLLTLVVVKDAVRAWLWDHGASPIYPAELRVHGIAESLSADALRAGGTRYSPTGSEGRVRVTGQHGLDVPELAVGVARHAEVAVALVRPADAGSSPTVEIVECAAVAAPAGYARLSNPHGLPARDYRVRTTG